VWSCLLETHSHARTAAKPSLSSDNPAGGPERRAVSPDSPRRAAVREVHFLAVVCGDVGAAYPARSRWCADRFVKVAISSTPHGRSFLFLPVSYLKVRRDPGGRATGPHSSATVLLNNYQPYGGLLVLKRAADSLPINSESAYSAPPTPSSSTQ